MLQKKIPVNELLLLSSLLSLLLSLSDESVDGGCDPVNADRISRDESCEWTYIRRPSIYIYNTI